MEPLLSQIIRLLKDAERAEIYRFYRHRFASPEQWAEEEVHMNKAGSTAWFTAKALICNNHDHLEAEIKHHERTVPPPNDAIIPIRAAQKVIKNEIEMEAEKALTSQE